MIKKTLLATSLLVASFAAQAQSIEDGTNIIGLGVRLGIYNLQITYKPSPPAPSSTNKGQTGSLIYPISYERGINDHITVGGQFRYNSFILAKDTSAQQINVAYDIDACVNGAYHFVRSEHTDIYLQAMVGFAYLKIANTNVQYQGVISAGGITYGLELGARFYIGDHFGIQINFAYSGYEYPSGNEAALGGYSEAVSLFFTGSTYGAGLCYKF
ncbi:MAG TPA: outer membrane beta-barrel protein [Bacteroidia bacterium]|jgi:hypothetical protein|nr:outer membrane beta-barrel protein [Bacteroidia bacterium]